MPVTVTWGTKVINIPQNYLTLISGSVYELDLDQLRKDLKALEDNEEGMPFPDTHQHNTEVTLAGITLARVIEFINGYTITFEDGQYAVEAKGANSNIADVMNLNQVSLRTFNSAGLISAGTALSQAEQDALQFLVDVQGGRWHRDGNQMIFYKSDNVTEVARFNLFQADGITPAGEADDAFERKRT